MRIVVSGGGSAGHITPTLAVSASLKQLDKSAQLLYIGQASSMEARIVAASKVEFAAIHAGKLRRNLRSVTSLALNARDLARTIQGFAEAIGILRRFKPDVIFLKGGYVCLPVGLAARVLHIPYVNHESDIEPGLTNRILSRWAVKTAVGFPTKLYHDFDQSRLVFTGNPVRPELLKVHRLEGMAAFNLDPNLPVILVTGGSQGARQINEVVVGALPELLPIAQVIHQTGDGEIERIKFELSRQPALAHRERYHPYAFLLAEMPAAMAAADLLIARAGAQTIAEAAVLRKPTVLIPNYQAAAHQLVNAKALARAGAARTLDGATLTPAKLVGEIKRLLGDPVELGRLEEGISAYGRPQAANELAALVLGAAKPAKPDGRAGDTEQ